MCRRSQKWSPGPGPGPATWLTSKIFLDRGKSWSCWWHHADLFLLFTTLDPVNTDILTISHFIVYSLMVSAVANGKWSNWWLNLGKILCTCFNVSCPVPKSFSTIIKATNCKPDYYIMFYEEDCVRRYTKDPPSLVLAQLNQTPLQTGHCHWPLVTT